MEMEGRLNEFESCPVASPVYASVASRPNQPGAAEEREIIHTSVHSSVQAETSGLI